MEIPGTRLTEDAASESPVLLNCDAEIPSNRFADFIFIVCMAVSVFLTCSALITTTLSSVVASVNPMLLKSTTLLAITSTLSI